MCRTLLLALLFAPTLCGCNRPSPTDSGVASSPVVGYQFEVRGKGAFTKGQAVTFSVQAGTNTASLEMGRLTVNGRSYGVVADGAKILIEENGKVLVDGEERRPE